MSYVISSFQQNFCRDSDTQPNFQLYAKIQLIRISAENFCNPAEIL